MSEVKAPETPAETKKPDEVTIILPEEWTLDDFCGITVCKWIFEHTKNSRFLRDATVQKADIVARNLGLKSFLKIWASYLREMNTLPADGLTTFPDQPMQLSCGAYTCDEYGVATIKSGNPVIVCNHPIMPVRRILDSDTGEQKIEIAYQREGESWRTMVVDSSTMATANRITSLARYGIGVNSENSRDLVKYLGEMVDANYATLPVQKSASHMGWLPDGSFVPYADDITCTAESQDLEAMLADIHQHGDEAIWMDLARKVRSGKGVTGRIALALAFAAPLVGKLGGLPFFVHLWGTSGCGKTVAMHFSASVWGDSASGRYVKVLNGTKTSLELNAAFCGSLPVYMDELQTIKDRKDFDDLIYMLSEGISKSRGARDGGLQKQRRWSTVFMTTGEQPLSRENSGGGAVARVLDVHVAEENIFDGAPRVADLVHANYGYAGRKYIEALREPGAMEHAKEVQQRFFKELTGGIIHDKQVLSASILLAADALADEYIFHDGKALTVEEIKPCLVTKEQVDPNVRCYSWLRGFIAGNSIRFTDYAHGNNGEMWGKVEDDGTVLFIKSFFDRVLDSAGFSSTSFLAWAKLHGKIAVDTRRDNRVTFRRRLGGSERVPCVVLLPELDEPEPTQEALIQVEVDDDMPF